MTAAAAASGGGLAFGVANVGNWLDVETTGADGAGFGMKLLAASAIGLESAGGIDLRATAFSITFTAPDFLFSGDLSGTDDFVVLVGGNMLLNGHTGNEQIALQSGVGIQLFANSGRIILSAVSGEYVLVGLPGADPGIPGALWNSAGTVKVSP